MEFQRPCVTSPAARARGVRVKIRVRGATQVSCRPVSNRPRDKLMRSTTRSIVPLLSIALAVGIAVRPIRRRPALRLPRSPRSPANPEHDRRADLELPGHRSESRDRREHARPEAHPPRNGRRISARGRLLYPTPGQPVKVLALGESFLIPAGVVHEEFAGPHAARILAVFTVEKASR